MSARLALFFAAAVASLSAMGCGASGRTEVSVDNLVMKVESNGAIKGGSFQLHLARPASASGSSRILLHTLEIRQEGDTQPSNATVARLRSDPPGDLDPGAELVSTIDFDLNVESSIEGFPFESCTWVGGIVLVGTYYDEAEEAFFTVSSPPTWLSPDGLTGTLWGRTFGDTGQQIAYDAAAFADGSSVVVGSTTKESGFPGAPPVTADTSFVMKLDAAGNTVWNQNMALRSPSLPPGQPAAALMGPSFVASSPSGGIVIAGNVDGTLDLGDGKVITSAGDTDVFLARLDAAGKATETRRFGDALAQKVLAMDVDAAANVVLVGTLGGAIDFGGGVLAPIIDPSVSSFYVARLPEAGAPIYAKVPLALQTTVQLSASVGRDGSVVLGGSFAGNAWIGAEPPHPVESETGFLLVLSPDGSIAWSAVLEHVPVLEVALDQGDVVAVLYVGDKSLVGGKELSAGPRGTAMLARFDPTGALRYAVPLDDGITFVPTDLIVDSAGHSLLTGTLATPLLIPGSSVDPRGRPSEPRGRPSTVFAEIDRSGAHVRSMLSGCASAPLTLAVSPTGPRDVLLTSTFSGAVSFGKGVISTAGSTDVFMAKLPAQ